jgi:hypothetical protein
MFQSLGPQGYFCCITGVQAAAPSLGGTRELHVHSIRRKVIRAELLWLHVEESGPPPPTIP